MKAALVFVLAIAAYAADHSAMNGTWTLVPAKSEFAGEPVIQTGTITIDDRQGNITVSRKFTYQGANETFFYSDSTDGERNAKIRSGDTISKTRWDHDSLKVTTTHDGTTTIETYSLAPDGTLTDVVERPSHQTIKLTFERE